MLPVFVDKVVSVPAVVLAVTVRTARVYGGGVFPPALSNQLL